MRFKPVHQNYADHTYAKTKAVFLWLFCFLETERFTLAEPILFDNLLVFKK